MCFFLFREFAISDSESLNSRTSTVAVYKAVILYLREIYFREAKISRILAKIKFSRTFPDLQ